MDHRIEEGRGRGWSPRAAPYVGNYRSFFPELDVRLRILDAALESRSLSDLQHRTRLWLSENDAARLHDAIEYFRVPRERLRLTLMSDILSDMKTVTLRALRRDSSVLDAAAEGEEIVVTRFGKPYVRIIPAQQPRLFLGAGTHLLQKQAVSSKPIPASEWKGLR